MHELNISPFNSSIQVNKTLPIEIKHTIVAMLKIVFILL